MSIFSVTDINRYLAFKFKEDDRLKGIMIKGEISNFTCHRASGHCYFTVKDDGSAIKAIMFKTHAEQLKFMPEDGMSVIVSCSVSVYEKGGNYQLYVTDIIPEGLGKGFAATEQLKKKLSKMGVFDESCKRNVPAYPKEIGVVTSPNGAALQDIINVIGRRYPVSKLTIFPCIVQGNDAEASVCMAMMNASKSSCDVIILARGGGSFEDLNAFNSEGIAMAVYNCSIPVISAVGHETDITIADLVADLRAPTPSAAAELAVPTVEQLKSGFALYEKRLNSSLSNAIQSKNNQLMRYTSKLEKFSPKSSTNIAESRINLMEKQLVSGLKYCISNTEKKLHESIAKLNALNPMAVLLRGYAAVYKDGMIVTSASELNVSDDISVHFGDGKIKAKVTDLE